MQRLPVNEGYSLRCRAEIVFGGATINAALTVDKNLFCPLSFTAAAFRLLVVTLGCKIGKVSGFWVSSVRL